MSPCVIVTAVFNTSYSYFLFFNIFLQVEWKGDLIIALCSKTYIAVDSDKKLKISAKGINHATLRANDPLAKFRKVLQSQQVESGVNKGFRALNGQMFTYSQEKRCLPYFYCKRYVHDDGIFTSCLDIVLRPVPKTYVCLQTDLPELAPTYQSAFRMGDYLFSNIKQALTFFKQQKHNEADHDALALIQRTTDCYRLDKLSAAIPDSFQWLAVLTATLEKIVISRMEQYPHFYDILFRAGSKIIINADKADKRIGIGENPRTVRWCPSRQNKGRNVLGQVYSILLKRHNDNLA